MKRRIHQFLSQAEQLVARDIWELEYLGAKSARARAYLLLRVLALTWQGLRRNKIPIQAAALTFYSLIGIGPLIALGIMVSGFIIDQNPDGEEAVAENMVTEWISKGIAFAAPQVTYAVSRNGVPVEKEASDAPVLDEKMTELINGFIDKAQSGTVGVVGSLMLFVIGLQVLASIESSFNTLWGAERGRKLGERVVAYWTLISLGAVLGVAAISLNVLPRIERFMSQFPFGSEAHAAIMVFSPIIAFFMLTVLLAVFFRFIPNTQVEWKPAFSGAVVVVLLLHLYNMLSFLYVQRVVDTRSLYGSVGIIVLLMLGLYVFWLLILLGGQVTYSVQNADFLTNENAWQKTSERSREVVSLGVLLLVAKAFKNGEPPLRASTLHERLRVPSHILNTCITRLCDLGYLFAVEGKTANEDRDRAFQAGKPLDSITLGSFKQAVETYGNNEGVDIVAESNPVIRQYLDEIVSLKDLPAARMRLDDLIHEGEGKPPS